MPAYTQVNTGEWNCATLNTWGTGIGGLFPVAGDTVTLKTGCTVTLTANAICSTITTAGTSILNRNGFNLTTTGMMRINTTGQVIGANEIVSFGNIEINGTGSFSAPGAPGITYITDRGNSVWLYTGGLVHNNGTIRLNSPSNANDKVIVTDVATIGRIFWNLEIYTTGQATQAPAGLGDAKLQVDNDMTIAVGALVTQGVYPNTILVVGRDLIIDGTLTSRVGANFDRVITVTRNAIIAGTLNANINGNGYTITVGSLQVSAGGLYSATSGQTIFSLDSSNAGTIRLPANCTLKSTDATKTLTLTTDIDWDFSAGTKTIKDFICALGAAMTTGGGGITLKNDNVDWSAVASQVQTVSVGDTFQIISNSDILTPTTIKTTVRGTLLVDTGITFKSGDIDAYGQVKTTGSGRINAQNRTVTGEATRMQLPVTYTNAVIRGDYYQDDIYNIGGCDLGLGYSY
jgi:hypothetical protein